MTPVVRNLIIANVLLFALAGLLGPRAEVALGLWPLGSYQIAGLAQPVGFRPWQLATYAFQHAGLSHLFFNMFGLYMFGSEVERVVGPRRFAALYASSVLAAGLTQLAVVSWPPVSHPYPTIGASGGVFGVLLAFAMLYPNRTVTLLFPPVPMRAWVFVSIYALIELVLGVTGTVAGVAHFAHLGGMAGAWLVLRGWRVR